MEPSGAPDTALIPDLEALAAADPRFATAYAACGPPPQRDGERGFSGLVRIVCGQQVSTHAAAAIWGRMKAAGAATPEGVRAADDDALRALGLSRAKVKALRGLAAAVGTGALDLDAIDRAPDDAVFEAVTALPGFGRWSAEMYLLFSLRRRDIWPAGDLAIRKALGRLEGLEAAPDAAETDRIGARFRPRRSAAARFLWHYLRHPGVA